MTSVLLRRTEIARPGELAITYYCTMVGVAIVAVVVAPEELGATIVAQLIGWAAVTGPIVPPRSVASRGFFIAVTLALAVRNYPDLPPVGRFWAVVAFAVCCSVFYTVPLRRTNAFPFLHLFCLVQAIYVYMSALVASPTYDYRFIYDDAIRSQGFAMIAAFMAIVVVVGSITMRALGSTPSTTGPGHSLPSSSVGRAYVLMVFGFGGQAAIGVLDLSPRLGALTNLVVLIGFGGVAMLAVLWMDHRLATMHKIAMLAVIAVFVVMGIGQMVIYAAALPGFVLLGLYLGYRRTVPLGLVLIAVLVSLTLNIAKSDLRTDIARGQLSGSPGDLGVAYLQRTTGVIGSSEATDVATAAYRFSNSDLLGYMGTWLPDRYPFFGNEVYSSIPYILVPRVLMPDKPKYNWANDVGRRYEILGRHDLDTSLNTPLATEAFIAGGYPIFVAVAVAAALFFALLGRLAGGRSIAMTIAGALICYSLALSVESGVLYLLLLVPYLFVTYLALRWACGGRSANAPHAAHAAIEGQP